MKGLMSILLLICWLLSICTPGFHCSLSYLYLCYHKCCSFLFCVALLLSWFTVLSVVYYSLLSLLCLYSILYFFSLWLSMSIRYTLFFLFSLLFQCLYAILFVSSILTMVFSFYTLSLTTSGI